MMNVQKSVNCQVLYDLLVLREMVNPWDLSDACSGLYRAAKIVGTENTTIYYQEKGATEKTYKKGNDIPEVFRAFAAFERKLYYRWNDDNSMRLEKHFGLPCALNLILEPYGVYKKNSTGVQEVMSLYDVVKMIAKNN